MEHLCPDYALRGLEPGGLWLASSMGNAALKGIEQRSDMIRFSSLRLLWKLWELERGEGTFREDC